MSVSSPVGPQPAWAPRWTPGAACGPSCPLGGPGRGHWPGPPALTPLPASAREPCGWGSEELSGPRRASCWSELPGACARHAWGTGSDGHSGSGPGRARWEELSQARPSTGSLALRPSGPLGGLPGSWRAWPCPGTAGSRPDGLGPGEREGSGRTTSGRRWSVGPPSLRCLPRAELCPLAGSCPGKTRCGRDPPGRSPLSWAGLQGGPPCGSCGLWSVAGFRGTCWTSLCSGGLPTCPTTPSWRWCLRPAAARGPRTR